MANKGIVLTMIEVSTADFNDDAPPSALKGTGPVRLWAPKATAT